MSGTIPLRACFVLMRDGVFVLSVLLVTDRILAQSADLQQANKEFAAGIQAYKLGRMDVGLAHWEQALALYQRVPNTERDQAACHQNIGGALGSMSRYEEAIARQEQALAVFLQIKGTDRQQADCHENIGLALLHMSRYEEAIVPQERALALYQRIPGTERDQADCHRGIGAALGNMARYGEAIAKQKQALALYLPIKGTESHQAGCYQNMGMALRGTGRYEEAIAKYEQALAMYQQIRGTERDQAACHHDIGNALWSMARYEEAIAKHEQALAMYQQIKGTERDQAACHHDIGNALWFMARYEEAIAKHEQALAMYQQIKGTERDQAACHLVIGNALGSMSRYEEAIARQEQALAMYRQIKGTERDQADCHQSIGVALQDMSRYEEAITKQKQALALYLPIKGTEPHQAGCYQNMGMALRGTGRYEEAIAKYEQALALYRQTKGTERDQGSCHVNIGVALGNMARYEEEIAKYEQALALFLAAKGSEFQQAACHGNIGAALAGMARYGEAIAKYEQALAMYQQIKGTERQQASCRQGIGVGLANLSRYEEAIAKHEQALAMFRQIKGTEREQAGCHQNIGVALQDMSRYEEAITKQEQALTLYQPIKGTERNQAACLANIATARRGMGQFIQVINVYRRARRQTWAVWINTGLAGALERMGSAEDLRAAAEELVYALSASETERGKSYGMEARMAASGQATPAYSHLARFLVNRSRENWELKEEELIKWATAAEPGLRCLEAACHFADVGKARTLIELIQRRQVDVGEDPNGKALLDEDRQLLAQIGKAHENRETARQKDGENTVKELEAKIDGWQQRRRQIEYELKKTYVGKFTVPDYQKASEIQSGLPEGLAILQYVVTEDDSRLIVLTRNSITAYDIPVKAEVPWDIPSKYRGQWKQDALAALAGRFATDGPKVGLEGLVRLYRAPMDTAQTSADAEKTLPETMVSVGLELGRLLLPEQMRKLLMSEKITHLVVIPDGQLHALPFAALPTGSRDSVEPKSLAECRFLIEDYRISYLPSWAMLGAIRSAAKERKAEGKQKEFLALADPVFGKEDRRVAGRPGERGPTTPVELAAVLRGYYEQYGWKRLEETTTEGRRVAATFGGVSVIENPGSEPAENAGAVMYTGAAATAKVLEHAGQYKRLLLATHGVADPRNAWLSCVVLSPDASQGYETPAFLKAADIIGLKLNADLVTLSACETGLGRLQSGEGMIGLSSAFFVAGARSLALTLWKVPSGETAEVSVRFHELLKTQPDKAEALRKAQLDFLANHPDKRHPFYWGAFVLTGDWQ